MLLLFNLIWPLCYACEFSSTFQILAVGMLLCTWNCAGRRYKCVGSQVGCSMAIVPGPQP